MTKEVSHLVIKTACWMFLSVYNKDWSKEFTMLRNYDKFLTEAFLIVPSTHVQAVSQNHPHSGACSTKQAELILALF